MLKRKERRNKMYIGFDWLRNLLFQKIIKSFNALFTLTQFLINPMRKQGIVIIFLWFSYKEIYTHFVETSNDRKY